jgi:hypothetical protein
MRLASILWILLAVAPAPAWAQDALPKAQQSRYRDLIAKALQEYSLGHWPEARVFFSDAHSLWPNARTFRGLGMTCYEARNYVEAIGFLEQALENRTQPLTDKLAAESRNILEQAKRFVTSAYITVSPDGATVTVDDKSFERRFDGAVLLDPGEHQLDVSAPGYHPSHRSFVAEAGRPMHLRVDLNSDTPLTPEAGDMQEDVPPEAAARKPARSSQPVAAGEEEALSLGEQSPGAAAALVGVGLASVTAGWVFFDLRNKVRVGLWVKQVTAPLDMPADIEQSELRSLNTRGAIGLAASTVGSVMFSVAQAFWLPDDPGVPPWAWVAGAVGVGVAVAAVVLATSGRHCGVTDDDAACQSITADVLLAPMVGSLAIPFLTLPIMYAAREHVSLKDTQVSFNVSQGSRNSGFSLQIAGRF